MPAQVERLRAENERLKAENERLRAENNSQKVRYRQVVQAIAAAVCFINQTMVERKNESVRRRGRVTFQTANFMEFGIRVCEMIDPDYEERLRQLFHHEFGVYPESPEGTQLAQNETYLPSSDEEREPDPEE